MELTIHLLRSCARRVKPLLSKTLNVFYFMGSHKMKRNQMAGIPQLLAKGGPFPSVIGSPIPLVIELLPQDLCLFSHWPLSRLLKTTAAFHTIRGWQIITSTFLTLVY